MKDIAIADVRNFVFMGHTGSGKTALIDSILFKLGVNDRIGSTVEGSSMSDWTDEEKQRQITIWAKPFDGVYTSKAGKKHHMVMMDTPGYADFFGQVVSASAVADAGLIVIDAASGVQVGTNRAWRRSETLGLPRGIVITGFDKENTDFDKTLASIQEIWGSKCIPVMLPTSDKKGVVSVLAGTDAGDLSDRVEELKGQLIEAAAESDDQLIEKYLGGETLSPEEIANGLRGSVRNGSLVPVFAAVGPSEIGLNELMENIAGLFPSPVDIEAKDIEDNVIDTSREAPFAGLVWRTMNDPFVGQLTFMRIYGGTLKPEGDIYNSSKSQKERIGSVYYINGKKQDAVHEAKAGDIVAFAKLKHTHLNDSLCAIGKDIKFHEIEFPNTVMSYAVEPKTKGDEDKIGTGLHRAAEEDPTIHVERNEETHELIISGMGDVHLDVTVHRMKARSKVDVDLKTPKVPYKETITSKGEGHHKHKKQSGGRGQYGEVYIRIEPLPVGDEDWFVNAIVGGAIPKNFIPAVEKGLVEAQGKGVQAGYPVINTKISLYDGSYHDVDSSEIAFKIAAAKAFADAVQKAKPVLLEPIMKLKIMVPEQYMGDVTGDMSHKRGKVLGMGAEDGMQVITAEAPQSELFKFCPELRSMTGGRGTFEMEFERYDIVPSNVAQKVIDDSKKDKQDDE